jgi:transposase-like protein
MAYGHMSLLDFQRRFPSEADCQSYLMGIRFSRGFSCPDCDSGHIGAIATRGLLQCKDCRKQFSVTAGTCFHRTRTSLQEWFRTIFLVSKDKRGHSALQLSKELGIPYARAWFILQKIKMAMAYRDSQYRLSGTIELDEAYFATPDSSGKGRRTNRTKSFVAVSGTDDGKPRFAKIQVVRRLDSRYVAKFAAKEIEPGSLVRTDGLAIYNSLAGAYIHEPIVAKGKPKDAVLKWVHVVISNAKAFIEGTFHGLDGKHLQRYLDEFRYRFNRRYREEELFDRLLSACTTAPPASYDALTE